MVDSFCQRWGTVPSVIRRESTKELFSILQLVDQSDEEEEEFDDYE